MKAVVKQIADCPTIKKNRISVIYPKIDENRQETFELVEGIRLSDQTTDHEVEMSCVEILNKLDEMETLYYDIAKIMNTIPGLHIEDGESWWVKKKKNISMHLLKV